MQQTLLRFGASLLLGASLAACNGSGGGNPEPPATPAPPTPPAFDPKAMIEVPGGYFEMGCKPGAHDPVCAATLDEQAHRVYVSPFRIDKYEVTFARYQACIDARVCTEPTVAGGMNFGRPGIEKFPVNGVAWDQAKTFCEWQGRRLPTEAEWERAARGDDGRVYPWGNQAPSCERAVVDGKQAGELGCGTGNTLDVGSKPAGASPYGAMDMAGNLWEWTADWYAVDYYANSPERDPKGPASGHFKSTRGGDLFARHGYEVRSTSRFPYEPSDHSPAIGFRCAQSL